MIKDLNFGLKLYSTDIELIPNAQRIKDEFFHFVELYIVPGSYEKTIHHWKDFDVPFIIHAPHSLHGFNLARAENWKNNLKYFSETRIFADELDSEIIIIHGGYNGSLHESIRQIKLLDEKRIILENKPKLGLKNELCIGWSPSEFRNAFETGVLKGIALDFGHAVNAANSLDVHAMTIIEEFIEFSPIIFHISDGDRLSEKDMHFNLGHGNFNLLEFVVLIPEGGLLTIETPRCKLHDLSEFLEDITFLNHLIKDKYKLKV